MSKQSLLTLLFIFCFLFLGLLLLDLLALNDIHNDYVSTSVLEGIKANNIISQLPDWSDTKGEWLVIQISMLAKLLLAIVNIFILFKIFKQKQIS